MSDSEAEIFLTQNSYRDSTGYETEAESTGKWLLGFGDQTFDKIDTVYQPEVSDISHEELVATCEHLEE